MKPRQQAGPGCPVPAARRRRTGGSSLLGMSPERGSRGRFQGHSRFRGRSRERDCSLPGPGVAVRRSWSATWWEQPGSTGRARLQGSRSPPGSVSPRLAGAAGQQRGEGCPGDPQEPGHESEEDASSRTQKEKSKLEAFLLQSQRKKRLMEILWAPSLCSPVTGEGAESRARLPPALTGWLPGLSTHPK